MPGGIFTFPGGNFPLCGGIFALPGGMFAFLAECCPVWWLVGFSSGLVGFLLFTWPGGLLIELIALHPAWHWRRSALHATRPSLNTQTAAYYLYFYPRWRNFRRIWGRIFSRSGEIFSGFGAEFSADLAKISAGPGRFSSPLACVVAAYVVEFSPLLSGFCAAYARFPPVSLLPGGLCWVALATADGQGESGLIRV